MKDSMKTNQDDTELIYPSDAPYITNRDSRNASRGNNSSPFENDLKVAEMQTIPEYQRTNDLTQSFTQSSQILDSQEVMNASDTGSLNDS